MKIDLHAHTLPCSKCSTVTAEDLIREAAEIGLDGFCLTEHQALPDISRVRQMGLEKGVRIFQGNEITTAQGDILVFGLDEDIPGIVPSRKLWKKVEAAGAFAIAAHPFRGFKVVSMGAGNLESGLELGLEQAAGKKIFHHVHAVEIRNGRVSDKENRLAEDVAKKMGMHATAGSDVHSPGDLGKWVTVFDREIETDAQLLEALHSGAYSVGTAR